MLPHGSATRAFGWAIVINLAYTALEAGYGFHTNSLALLSDALHNLGDVLGLGLAWGAAKLAQRPPTQQPYLWLATRHVAVAAGQFDPADGVFRRAGLGGDPPLQRAAIDSGGCR